MQASEHDKRRRDESVPWIPALVIVLVIIAGVYYWLYGREAVEMSENVTPAEKPLPDELKVPEEKPAIKYPVTAPETAPPSVSEATPEAEKPETREKPAAEPQVEPEVETSTPEPQTVVKTPTLNETLSDFLGRNFEELFIPDSLVRNFVVTVDNMTSEKLPQRYSFTRPPPGKFAIIEEPDGSRFLDPANYDRYRAYISLAENVDLQRLTDIYVRYYHLFQQAYENLGYPDRYFNDRLVEVIDNMLAAPEVTGRIALVQPKVFYRFSNPKLQALSAGQKILVRMGPDNATRVKDRLRELRRLLTEPGTR